MAEALDFHPMWRSLGMSTLWWPHYVSLLLPGDTPMHRKALSGFAYICPFVQL